MEIKRPVLKIAVAIEGTRKEKGYVPVPRSSKRLLSRVSGESSPKRTCARGAEGQSAMKEHEDPEVDRYFAKSLKQIQALTKEVSRRA